MLAASHQPKCAYCGHEIPQVIEGRDTAWLMEKASYGLNVAPWRPQSRTVWDVDKFWQFCSFACAEPMMQDFIKKEKWAVAAARTKEKVKS